MTSSLAPTTDMAADATDPMRWARRAGLALVLVCGWLFIVGENRFHVTPPVFFVCLGYLAVVATVWNLWRIGSLAVSREQATEEAWAKPIGHRAELEKEKRTLLKAIKEAEFDHEMGKLSKTDADELVTMYRGRAIAVIRELDGMAEDGGGGAGDVKARIAAEVRARMEVKGRKKEKGKEEEEKDLGPRTSDLGQKQTKTKSKKAESGSESGAGSVTAGTGSGADTDTDTDTESATATATGTESAAAAATATATGTESAAATATDPATATKPATATTAAPERAS
jgi:hypothetical protein